MILNELSNEFYTLHHLTEDDVKDVRKFKIDNPKGKGLEIYLNEMAYIEEKNNNARTYLVRDAETQEVAAYFTLKTGIVTKKTSLLKFNNITGIELANFAVNDSYRKTKDVVPQFGKYIFIKFILPLVKHISKYVGAQYLYIFALSHNRLMMHYSSMGFERFSMKLERFIHRHIKPTYDRGCIFMYQKIL